MKGLGVMLLFELDRRQVFQRHMRPLGVVVRAPGLDDDLRFPAASEPLQVQAFVPQAAVKDSLVRPHPAFGSRVAVCGYECC